MIKLIRLIEVQLKNLTNYDRIKIAKEYKVNDSSETRIIILGILLVIYGLIINYISEFFVDIAKDYMLIFAYLIAYLSTLFYDLINVKNVLFSKNEDVSTFSLPIDNKNIIISKLFSTYLINLIIVFIIMFPMYLSLSKVIKIQDVVSFSYILAGFTIPFIPMIISSFYAFIDSYYSISKDKKKYMLVKVFIILLLYVLLYYYFRGTKLTNLDHLSNKLILLNPLLFLFKLVVIRKSFISILLVVSIPIIFLILFVNYFSINYTHFISYIKGVKIKEKREVKVGKKKTIINSLITKEYEILLNNKLYLSNSILYTIIFSFVYLVGSILLKSSDSINTKYMPIFIMIILSFIIGNLCITIYSLSLEKNNLINYKTLPIRFYKVLLSKWLANIIIALPIILVNILVTMVVFKYKYYYIIIMLFNSIFTSMFISLFGLALDYRFICRDKDDVFIIKSRIVSYVPRLVLLVVCVMLYFVTMIDSVIRIMLVHTGVLIMAFVVVLVYLLINYKKIYNSLIN